LTITLIRRKIGGQLIIKTQLAEVIDR